MQMTEYRQRNPDGFRQWIESIYGAILSRHLVWCEARVTWELDYISIRRLSSFMYDEEPRFPFKSTQNAAHIEYSRRGLSYLMTQRCSLKNIARSGAIIELISCVEPPLAMTLDMPDANAGKIGCVRWGGNSVLHRSGRLTLRLRFLTLLSERQLASVLAHSTLVGEDRNPSFFC